MAAGSIEVVAGVIRDDSGRILLAQRAEGSHLAGLWEFPGGKRETGESRWEALVRELDEELGIVASAGRPLIGVPFSYADKSIRLDVWQIDAFAGTPWSREGQALRWVDDVALDAMPMPDADRPAIAALRLPDLYLITPDLLPSERGAIVATVECAIAGGMRLIQLRLPQWSRAQMHELATMLRPITRATECRLLVNADIELAIDADLDGVHLPSLAAATYSARPLPASKWLGVSCHDANELAHAARIGADFATLSPVQATPSHPANAPLGWERFGALVHDCPLPVYALGGLGVEDVSAAQGCGAQGIAAIRHLWPG